MKIIYFDEVKFEANRQPYYWLGGIAIDAENIPNIETQLDNLALEYFGDRNLSRATEFHASDIYNRKHNFKLEKNHAKRRELLMKLAEIASSPEIGRICVRIEPGKMYKSNSEIPNLAFMYFVEQVEGYLTSNDDIGILIGDRESNAVTTVFAEALSRYRNEGTDYEYGKKLHKLVDTVHFTESHLCRLLQLADSFIWLYQFFTKYKPTKYSADLYTHIQNNTKINHLDRLKIFPTNLSRLQR
jgi:hypothetical protein